MVIKKILFSTLLLLIISNAALASDKVISEGEIKSSIDKMLLSKKYKYKIIKVSKVFRDLCVVAISPPYREFPNVIIFKYENSRWYRIFEGFCVGIKSDKSDKLDLHTIGLGADVVYSKDGKPIFFDEDKLRTIMTAAGCKQIIIQYDNFTHLHLPGDSNEFYTIDKSNFRKYAVQLLGDTYYPESRQECVMFDMPEIIDIEFSFKGGRFIIQGQTDNGQIWNISFEDIGVDKMFFKNKKIFVRKITDDRLPIEEYQQGFNNSREVKLCITYSESQRR